MKKRELLKKYFGYDSFREGQEELMDAVLGGRDVLGIMPTGAGKSLCYQLPALMMEGVTIVVSPLISLMKDQVQALNEAGIHAAYINSSLTETQISKALALAEKGRYKIIYVAPERLETYAFRHLAENLPISMITVDEAHCISQWGQDFRPSYLNILDFIRLFPARPVISAFTATATKTVREDIACTLGLLDPVIRVTGFDRSNLYFSVETPRSKDAFVLDYVRQHAGESGIIYCATRKNTEKICMKLNAAGIPTAMYHAGMENEARAKAQEDFIYDNIPVIAATNAFGMGIDKSNVRYVLHYNMPQNLENYYQEAGRAGRDGLVSECILLYSGQDVMINRFLLEHKAENPEFTEEDRETIAERDNERLRIMVGYALTRKCLRKYILNYFGEPAPETCGNCSSCSGEFEDVDITEEAIRALACVREMSGRFGINMVTGTLAGSTRAKLREYHADQYASYGSLREKSEPEIKKILETMLEEGLLAASNDKYGLLRVTADSRRLTEDGERLLERRPKEKMPEEYEEEPVYERMAGNAKQHSDDLGRTNSGDTGRQPSGNTGRQRKSRRSDILNSRGLQLFDVLRTLRTDIAREQGLPPYIVFADKALVDMCIKLPMTKQEMLSVNGVGENKYDRYGEQFMNAIREFTGGKKEKMYYG